MDQLQPEFIKHMWEAELIALVISCLIEGPISYQLGRLTKWPCRGAKYMGWASVWATCITHPQMWYMFKYLTPLWSFWPTFLVVEALVYVAEGFLIWWMTGLRLDRAMLTSCIANTGSALFGLLLSLIFTGQFTSN